MLAAQQVGLSSLLPHDPTNSDTDTSTIAARHHNQADTARLSTFGDCCVAGLASVVNRDG